MLRKLITIAITLGIIAVVGLVITIMGNNRPRPDRSVVTPPPPSVFYTVTEGKSVTLDVSAQGEVRPRTDINLTAQVSGRIIYISPAFVDGGAFRKNDTLVSLEDADYKLAVTRALSNIAQAEQVYRQEKAEADLARRDWEELGGGGTPSDLTLRLPQLAQAKASLDSANASLSEAKLNLSRANIKAPFDGRVRRRVAGQGQFVAPGASLGQIFSTDVAEIRLPLTDTNLGTLGLSFGFIETPENPGPEVILRATVGATANEWRGRIARTEGAIDSATRQIGAIAVVEDPYGANASNGVPLAVGLFVEGTIKGRPFPNAITLPLQALYGRDTVYIVNADNKLEKRIVTVASTSPKEFVVVDGLSIGERVIISPLRGTDVGDVVTPLLPGETPPKPVRTKRPESSEGEQGSGRRRNRRSRRNSRADAGTSNNTYKG